MTQVIRVCKFGCGRELGEFSTKDNKYLELDGTLHTRERCEGLKAPKQVTKDQDLSVEVLLKRLDQLGISIDLSKLRLVK